MKLVVERFEVSVVTGEPIVQVTDQYDGTTVTFDAEEYASLTGWQVMQSVKFEREIELLAATEIPFAETGA